MENNEIIKHLTALPPGEIYYISQKQSFVRGYDYYRQERILRLVWSKDSKVLIAMVQGSRIYSISFFEENGELRYMCNCPVWTPSRHCKHVICAILTIKNLLNPDLFHISSQGQDRRRILMAGIMPYAELLPESVSEADEEVSLYSIVIQKRRFGGLLEISVEKNNTPISNYHYSTVPKELLKIVRETGGYYYSDPGISFLNYLRRHGNQYPLFLKINNRKIPVEWDPSLVFSPKTEIDVTQGIVTIKRLCIYKDNICKKPYFIGGNLISDLETGKLGVIGGDNGWEPWRVFQDHFSKDLRSPLHSLPVDEEPGYTRTNYDNMIETIDIPIKTLRNMQLIIPYKSREILHDLLLKIEHGHASLNKNAKHDYSIVIDMHNKEKDKMILRACCNLDGVTDSTTISTFSFLPFIAENGYRIPYPLKAKKRWAILVRTFLKLLSCENKEQADKIIRESLSNEEFYKHVVRREAKRLLTGAFSMIKTSYLRIQFCNNQWHMTRNNINKEVLLYTIPFELFGTDIFRDMKTHNEMTVNSKELYTHFLSLHQKLRGHGIQLSFKGKRVITSKWDVSIDANRGVGIDWFEVKPEIRYSGELLDEESWKKALEQNGVLEGEELIHILDSNTHEILKAISAISRKDGASPGKEKEIVTVPRLKILDWIFLRNKGVNVKLSKEDEYLIERLSRFEKIEVRPLPEKSEAKLRHYQKEGYYWLSFLYEHRFGACLADDMGLGKTLQAITLLAGIKEGKVQSHSDFIHSPHLIILPPSLLFNWENELKRFYPDFKLYFYTGQERSTDFKDYDIVLTTYGLIRRDIKKLKDILFNVIVFDEAQAIKNIYAETTGAVRQLKGHFKLTMTGTPLENHLGEYYSILDLSLPGLLGEYDDFKSYIDMETSPFIDIILRRTRPFVLRRTKEKILKELPPKIESDIYLELTERQKALYKKTVEMIKSTIDKAYANKTASQAQIIALTAILKLRQLCISPRLIDPLISEPSPKIEFLLYKLKELLSEGHKALVFSQFTSFLNILEEDLKKNEIPFYRLDGSTPVRSRKALVEGFQKDDSASVFLLSLKAGGQGLNLTRASYVFHLDPWWNPAVENQASDRAHRIGQKNKVNITRILMRHTVEEKMMELKKKKLELYKVVMEDSVKGRKGLSISRSDFDYLLN